MAVRILGGNAGKTFQNPTALGRGVGSRVTVFASAAADVALVDGSMVFGSAVELGTTFQLAQSSGTLKIDITLSPYELVINNPSLVAWHQLVATLAPNAMQQTLNAWSAARLTFNGSGGFCYIAAF